MSIQTAASQLVDFLRCAWALGSTPAQKWRILWSLSKNFRVRLGLARYHPNKTYRLKTRYGELTLRDNFGDVTNLPDLLYRNVYRLEHLASEGVILDIGANIGLFAAWATAQNPGRPIHCFEVLPTSAELISYNCPEAIVNQVGLGAARGAAVLKVDEHGIMASRIGQAWAMKDHEFAVIPLDEYCRAEGIEQVAFMKVDTEGMEVEILDGGAETLRRTQRVAMETHSPELHRESLRRLRQAGLGTLLEEFDGKTGLIRASRG